MGPLHRFIRDWHSQVISRTARLHDYVLERVNNAPASRSGTPAALVELIAEIEGFGDKLHQKSSRILAVMDPPADFLWSTGAVVQSLANDLQALHQKLQFVPARWAKPELDLFLRGILDEKLPSYRDSPQLRGDSWTIVLSSAHNFANLGLSGELGDADIPRLQNVLTIPAAEESNVSVWPNLVHELGHMIERSTSIIKETKETTAYRTYMDGADVDFPSKAFAILGYWIGEIVADLIATDILGPAYFLALSSFAAHWYRFPLIKATDEHPSCDTRLRYILRRLQQTSMKNSEIVDALKSKWDARMEVDLHLHAGDFHDKAELRSQLPPEQKIQELADQIVKTTAYSEMFGAPRQFNGGAIWPLERRIARGELIATRRVSQSAGDNTAYKEGSALKEVTNDVSEIVSAAIFFQNSCSAIPRRLWDSDDNTDLDHEGAVIEAFCSADGGSIGRKLEQVSNIIARHDASVTKSIEARAIAKFYGND